MSICMYVCMYVCMYMYVMYAICLCVFIRTTPRVRSPQTTGSTRKLQAPNQVNWTVRGIPELILTADVRQLYTGPESKAGLTLTAEVWKINKSIHQWVLKYEMHM